MKTILSSMVGQDSNSNSRKLLICLCLFHWPVLRSLGLKKYWGPNHLHLFVKKMKLLLVFLLSLPLHGFPSINDLPIWQKTKIMGRGQKPIINPIISKFYNLPLTKAIMDLLSITIVCIYHMVYTLLHLIYFP